MHWNFLRSLLPSSIGLLSYRVTNLFSLAITPPQLWSSIVQLPRILSCSAVFDNFGSPLLFSISKCLHYMSLTNTTCWLPQSLAFRSFSAWQFSSLGRKCPTLKEKPLPKGLDFFRDWLTFNSKICKVLLFWHTLRKHRDSSCGLSISYPFE